MNALDGPARNFFYNHFKDDWSYDAISDLMRNEYDSDARQLQVQNALENLRLQRFMSEKEIASASEGLTKVVDHIEKLSPECPPSFPQDAHKIRFLRNAVKPFPWSRTPISNIVTLKYNFNQLVTALRESLEFESELRA